MSTERPLPVHLRPDRPASVLDVVRGVQGLYLTLASFALLTVSSSLGDRFGLAETLAVWPLRYVQLMALLGLLLGASLVLLTVVRVLKHLTATEVDIEPGRFEVRRMLGLLPVSSTPTELDDALLELEVGAHHLRVEQTDRTLVRRRGVRHDDVWLLADAVKDRNRVVLGNRARF